MARNKKFIKRETFANLETRDFYFRNFRGINKYNPKDTESNFAIKLPEAMAEDLKAKGWHIRWTKVKPEAPEDIKPIPYLKVSVNFNSKKPPVVNMIIGKTVTQLDEKSIASLDSATIDKFTFEITPYDWDESGQYGAKAYLKAMNVFCEESLLESELRKYMEEFTDDEEEVW